MKKICILLIFLFAPLILNASDETFLKRGEVDSIWNQRFPDGFNRKYPDTPSLSLVSREIFRIIRSYNPPIDKFANWLGSRLGYFVPAGSFVVDDSGEIDHRKKNVNVLDSDLYSEDQKKISRYSLFSYKLQPRLYFGQKVGLKLIIKKSFWDYHFTLVNEYKNSRDDGYYLLSMFKINFVF